MPKQFEKKATIQPSSKDNLGFRTIDEIYSLMEEDYPTPILDNPDPLIIDIECDGLIDVASRYYRQLRYRIPELNKTCSEPTFIHVVLALVAREVLLAQNKYGGVSHDLAEINQMLQPIKDVPVFINVACAIVGAVRLPNGKVAVPNFASLQATLGYTTQNAVLTSWFPGSSTHSCWPFHILAGYHNNEGIDISHNVTVPTGTDAAQFARRVWALPNMQGDSLNGAYPISSVGRAIWLRASYVSAFVKLCQQSQAYSITEPLSSNAEGMNAMLVHRDSTLDRPTLRAPFKMSASDLIFASVFSFRHSRALRPLGYRVLPLDGLGMLATLRSMVDHDHEPGPLRSVLVRHCLNLVPKSK